MTTGFGSSIPAAILLDAARDPRVRAPLLFLAAVMLLLSFERLAICAAMRNRFKGVSPGNLLKSFVVGWRFDMVMACILSLPLFVATAFVWPGLAVQSWFRTVIVALSSGLFTVTFFLCLADFFFFMEFDQRLDAKVIDYLRYDYVYKIVWSDFPVLRAFLLTAAAGAGSVFFFQGAGFVEGWNFSLTRAVVWPVLSAFFLFFAIRGTFGPKAINTGPAYFSNDLTLAQLTLNGLFTLREAIDCRIYHHDSISNCVETVGEKEAFALAGAALERTGDTFPGEGDNPLMRITDTGRKEEPFNVVLVILESLSWHYIGALGGREGLTPNLEALAAEGILMERCFAVGSRTPNGFSGAVCGFPDLPGMSVTMRSAAEGRFLSLGSVLEERGYERMFIYGGNPIYDHRQAFLRSNGFNRFMFRGDFEEPTFSTHLGWCDGDLFEQAHREFVRMEGRPFLSVLLTLSFHRPYEIPEGKCEPVSIKGKKDPELTCVRYTDWAVGRFMEKARASGYHDRTIFVFVADHTGGSTGKPISPAAYRIPFLVYAPGVLGREGRRISTVCSQTDVPGTIMSLLGGTYHHCFFGSGVLDRPREKGLALMQHSSQALALADGNEDVVVLPCGHGPEIYGFLAPGAVDPLDLRDPAVAARREKLSRLAVALFESAEILFDRGAYNLGRSERLGRFSPGGQ